LIAAHGSELGPGRCWRTTAIGVPLLLTRDAEGRCGRFLNVCRHRGMRLVRPGAAQKRDAMVCPYHGWSYRLDGSLRHRLHAEAFDACPAADMHLVGVPVAERHGLVWVVPDATAGAIDLEAFLGGLDAELPLYQLEDLRLFRTVEAEYPRQLEADRRRLPGVVPHPRAAQGHDLSLPSPTASRRRSASARTSARWWGAARWRTGRRRARRCRPRRRRCASWPRPAT
jgi:phenylpropionate dioxygenase-like ring-hydroxylating dioxygenase large terminal subunit